MRIGSRWRSAAIASVLLTASATCLANSPASIPAVWSPYNLIIELDHLPKSYACNDLWYKFRDVLWTMGARGISEILPYQCGPGRADHGLSPKVHVVFVLPEAATGIEVRQAAMRATRTQIRLAPGQPKRLDDSDCELLRQMDNSLIPALSLHVVSSSWNCQAPVAGQPRFALTLQVLKSATAPKPQAQ